MVTKVFEFLRFKFSGFYLILFHLIGDHLQPCDEVPVDDCAAFAFVLQKPFTVVSHIIPLAVLLALKHIIRKSEIVGIFVEKFPQRYCDDLVFALGQISTGRLETKRCFHLFQLPVVADPDKNGIFEMFTVAVSNLHGQRA